MGETIVTGREPLSDIFDMSQWFSKFEFSFHDDSRGMSSGKFQPRKLEKKDRKTNAF
jgi:hypothetical protein